MSDERCLTANFSVDGFKLLYQEKGKILKITIVETDNDRFTYHDGGWKKEEGECVREYKRGRFVSYTPRGYQAVELNRGTFQIVPEEAAEKFWADMENYRD